jgi:hypothetical protein
MIESNEELRQEQTALLKDLIVCKITTDEFRAQDKLHFITDNDYYDDLAELTRQDIINVLERYLAQELPSRELHYWGELIEARETIGREANYTYAINQAIRYLADEVNEENPLTPQMAQFWIDDLRNAKKDQWQ